MKRLALLGVAVLTVALLVPTSASAEKMFMSAATAALKKCDTLHHEQTCDRYHVAKDPVISPVATVASSTTSGILPGTRLTFDNLEVNVEWAGEGYRLTSGEVIAPDPSNAQQWLQIYPSIQPAEVSGWTDSDANNYFSAADTVEVDGVSRIVKESRFYLWVESAQ